MSFKKLEANRCKKFIFLASNAKISRFCVLKKILVKKVCLLLKIFLNKSYNYAVLKKEDETLIKSVSFKDYLESSLTKNLNESEIGYWIGKKFFKTWLCFRSLKKLIKFRFLNLSLKIIGNYYENLCFLKNAQIPA